MPPAEDPYLARLTANQLGYVEAGRLYYEGAIAKLQGNDRLAAERLAQFHVKIPVAFRPETDAGDAGNESLE